jgi:adenylosuccinate synthase
MATIGVEYGVYGAGMATRQRMVVVVSGPVAGGKSALARGLAHRFDGLRLSTRGVLMSRLTPNEPARRETLQRIGAEWDAETGGSWVADRLGRDIWRARERGRGLVIVDAARIAGQVEGLPRRSGARSATST